MKPGDKFRDVVEVIHQATFPKASVKYELVEGPDGERDIDVAIRSNDREGNELIMIECKDWKRKVGIDVVDALDSKRNDVGADIAMICSNSGFTIPAMKKARRRGIILIAALKLGDQTLRWKIQELHYDPIIYVDMESSSFTIFPANNNEENPLQFNLWDLMYDGLPLVNWVAETIPSIAQARGFPSEFTATYTLRDAIEFSCDNTAIRLSGLRLHVILNYKWARHIVDVDATMGTYDVLSGRMTIAPSASGLYDIDISGIKIVSKLPRDVIERDMLVNRGEERNRSVEINLAFVAQNLPKVQGITAPNLTALIGTSDITTP